MTTPPAERTPETAAEAQGLSASQLTRRGFLRAAGVTGLAGVAATVAACQAAGAPSWSFGPAPSAGAAASAAPSATAAASAAASVAPSAAASPSVAPSASANPDIPAGWTEHDVAARDVVRRYVGNLATALEGIYGPEVAGQLGDILGVADNYPELTMKPAFVQVPQVVLNDILDPLKPETDGEWKVFRITIDEIEQAIDEMKPTVAALGYNKQTPGPTIRVNEGDKVRAIFTNNLKEATGVHFHGVEFDNFFMDGVPFITQKPFGPGESFTYEFTASRPGTLMYHSHHNATDQVGRGLLGGFIVDPRKPSADDKYDREYSWISNDVLGGFTINGHGFPATVPVLVAVGETVRVRFMNEGIMYHPFHSHGYKMKVVARDGYPLGQNAYDADTITVGPGERWDVNITADRVGVWAFHCHILPHVEGADGMFGMVNTLFVVPKSSDIDAIVQLLLA
ncbi:MAG TPA: multicopper oxidase domain-containing protein [Candidatus Limnocylindrales bacterium]|nr:multicopper oxidase domain-containing protein [Candidatus Limnocylindrales bacterium]